MYICDYNAIIDKFVDILQAANTTTAAFDISAGLTKRAQTIARTDLSIVPEFKANYPLVNVRLIDRREYPGAITGSNFNREIFLDMKIQTIYDDFAAADENNWKLLSNVEANLRYSKDLWNYEVGGFKVLSVLPKETTFKTKFGGDDSTFSMSGEIQVELKGLLKSI